MKSQQWGQREIFKNQPVNVELFTEKTSMGASWSWSKKCNSFNICIQKFWPSVESFGLFAFASINQKPAPSSSGIKTANYKYCFFCFLRCCWLFLKSVSVLSGNFVLFLFLSIYKIKYFEPQNETINFLEIPIPGIAHQYK